MKKSTLLLCLTILVYFAVILVNDGFMATDEYFVGITRYIPAQSSSIAHLLREDDVKSPAQLFPMFAIAQVALKLGIETPYMQYRAVILVIGLINLALLLVAVYWLTQKSERDRILALAMLCFYFAAPFAFTRPMFEALAAPWLALAGVAALRYDHEEKLGNLLAGVFFGSMAFILRQQVGFCALIFILLPILKKRWQDLIWASALGLVFFLLSGLPDLWVRGEFHGSLKAITVYNFQHGEDYGRQPITYYPLLILVMTFSPFFIARYPKGFIRNQIRQQRSLWIMVFLFVFLHSLFAQKWERFLISIIPLILFIMQPYLAYLLDHWSKYKVRLTAMFALNGVIFFVASFFPPQKNLIGLSLYLNDHPEIKKLYKLENVPEWITDAFILNQQYQFVEAKASDLGQVDWNNCDNAVVVGELQKEQLKDTLSHLQKKAEFPVNQIEHLAFLMNPKRNPRRVKLELYGCVPGSK